MTATVSARQHTSLPYRPAIDGLRAFAVLSVICFHLLPASMPGGWFGVDVFFVISGFLITALLLAEYRRERGHIDLVGFWFARARRLLPALFLVLAVVLVGATFLTVSGRTGNVAGDVLATLGYVANWRFVLGDEAYFGQGNGVSNGNGHLPGGNDSFAATGGYPEPAYAESVQEEHAATAAKVRCEERDIGTPASPLFGKRIDEFVEVRAAVDANDVRGLPGREPHRVLVPVEHVEGRRRLAEQVVVDDVVEDQVVGAHPAEHRAHLAGADDPNIFDPAHDRARDDLGDLHGVRAVRKIVDRRGVVEYS